MTKPICLITGVGDGTGSAIARRFAQASYQVAMMARNRARLQQLECEITDAKAFTCDITGNTAALRGIPTYALFAPTKAAQRILSQSLARELGPKGVHVAYITIDAAIATPWSMDKPAQGLNTEPLNQQQNLSEDFFCQPLDIAEEVFHVAHQPRSAWSFDVEIRPFGEKW